MSRDRYQTSFVVSAAGTFAASAGGRICAAHVAIPVDLFSGGRDSVAAETQLLLFAQSDEIPADLFTPPPIVAAPVIASPAPAAPIMAVAKLYTPRRKGTSPAPNHPRFPYKFPRVSVYKWQKRGRPSDAWLIAYRDPVTNKHRYITGSSNVEFTMRKAKEISDRIEQHRLGLKTPEGERVDAYAVLPLLGRWRSRDEVAAELRRADREAAAALKEALKARGPRVYVPGHLDAHHAWMMAKGRNEKYCNEVRSRTRKMIRLCRWKTAADVRAETLELVVAETLRDDRDYSLKTCNDYLKNPAQFMRWLADPRIGRAKANPLARLEKYNAATDPRRERRAISHAELLHLLETTRNSAPLPGQLQSPAWLRAEALLSGEDRASYYLIKMHTGFRGKEMASLTRESFALDVAAQPTVTCKAADSKHRKQDVQTIRRDLVDYIRPWLESKAPGVRFFAAMHKPIQLWRYDLEAAGIPYQDAQGRYADLHAIRHTFATELGRTGASIKAVQQLMRHSDPRLTAKYMHAGLYDELAALGGLPMPPAHQPEANPVAGRITDDQPVAAAGAA